MTTHYPTEHLGPDDDDGTMPDNVEKLTEAVVGHRIVKVKKAPTTSQSWGASGHALFITLDNGTTVELANTDDCCAYTEVESFLLHAERIDHIITGVGTTDGYTTWHVYADMGDVLEVTVGWSCGNPFYYGYGFDITVEDAPTPEAAS